MHVTTGAAVVAQAPHARGQVGVIRSHQAGLPIGAEILGGVKAECRGHTHGSGAAVAPGGANRLGGVFDQCQVKLVGKWLKPIHVGALAIKMDGKQRSQLAVTAAPQMGFNLRGIEIEGNGIDVGKHRTCPGARNRASGGEKTEGSSKNVVSGLHAGDDQGEPERVRSRRAADGFFHSTEVGEVALEGLHLTSQNVLLRGTHPPHRRQNLGANLFILPLQVEQRYGSQRLRPQGMRL